MVLPTIFISYRRQDSGGHTGRLRDHLRRRFGELVFRDVDDIPDGAKFDQILDQALGQARVGVVVIGPQWLSCTDANGQRRLDDPQDWVRQEIRKMLERDLPVIPVLVGGVRSLDAQSLPEDIRTLAKRQARILYDESWDAGVAALSARLDALVGRPRWRLVALAAVATLLGAGALWLGLHPNRDTPITHGEAHTTPTQSAPVSESGTPLLAAAERLGALGPWVMDDFSGMEVKDPSVNFELRAVGGELQMVPLDGADRTPWRVVRLVDRAFVFESAPVSGREPSYQYSMQLSAEGKRIAECQTLDRKTLASMGACTWAWVRPGEARRNDPTCGQQQSEVDRACLDAARQLNLYGDWVDPKGGHWLVQERGDRVVLLPRGGNPDQSPVLLSVEGRDIAFAPTFGSRVPPELDAQTSYHFERSPDGSRLTRCRERTLLASRTDEQACGPDQPAALRRP